MVDACVNLLSLHITGFPYDEDQRNPLRGTHLLYLVTLATGTFNAYPSATRLVNYMSSEVEYSF